jgi:apolipoprotein N-acyltransferase
MAGPGPAARSGGRWAGIVASALLCGLYARGGAGWVLGFVALVPWLRGLDGLRAPGGTLLCAWAMSVGYAAAAFGWFGIAIGAYTGWGPAIGLALLLLAAPAFQPQFLTFALVRQIAGGRHGRLAGGAAAIAAWVATEAFVPRVLGDTLGEGLYPASLLRQAADLGGAPGLTVALLLCNEAIAAMLDRRTLGLRAMAPPAALAIALPSVLAAYGATALARLPVAPSGPPLRIGLVQSAITDYERMRQEKGAYATVREVLDTHFAMSFDAVEHQHADAVMWSETVYPTTFGHPKSEAGAQFDREILDFVDAAGVPFVFGTYDRDTGGEYIAAAFVSPVTGLLAFYRKTRLFPLTEHVPAWLDGRVLRRALPWSGTWQPGLGARVLPLRLADGREIPVLPMICLDDTDSGLAIAGTRLGARAILTLSNDAWFSADGPGADLHLAAAAFRSIETRLPQFRVTTNGDTAVIDAAGVVVARAPKGQRALVVADAAVPEPPRTLMVAWGDWVGRAAGVGLLLFGIASAWRGRRVRLEGVAISKQPGWPTRLDHPVVKFILYPLALAIPAFRLHQYIAFGGAFGEYYAHGLRAYLTTLALWWAQWAIGMLLVALALRAAIEALMLAAKRLRPEQAPGLRRTLEVAGRLLFYLGVPAWFALRVLGG